MAVDQSVYNALVKVGRPMILRRRVSSPPTDVTVRGVNKGYQPQELVGTITQGDTKVIFSNIEIASAAWPAPPKKGDFMVIDGVEKSIMAVEQKFFATTIVVYVCQVRG